MQDDCITVQLGLPGLRVLRHEEGDEAITVEVMYRAESAVCPHCGRRTPKVHSVRPQRKRDQRLWNKPVFIILHKRRFRCWSCRKVFTETDPIFGARKRTSGRMREHLGREAIHHTVRHVARQEGVGEGLVRRCLTEEAARLLEALEETSPVRVMGLDEFSVRKGRVYDTAIMNIESKRVMGVVSGHRKEEVAAFFDALPAPEQVQVVVMDMHEPFRQAVDPEPGSGQCRGG